jgi:glucose/arabinose dehydrogenase
MPRTFGAALSLLVLLLPAMAHAALGRVQVASGLELPIYVTAPPGDHRLFIVERRGVVKILEDGQVRPTPFMDVDSLVMDLDFSYEVGFWGLTFHPAFPDSPYVYVCYADTSNDVVVSRYTVSETDPNVVDYSSARTFVQMTHPFRTHYGGHLAFGPDHYLYLGIGDGGLAGDPGNRAQDGFDMHGKLLRIDVDGGPPYSIPSTNPFLNNLEFRDEIWAYGFRNPYRWSFDRLTGDLWVGDVGQDQKEEVDFTPASSREGENYGWPMMEGTSCYRPSTNCWDPSFHLPAWEYIHGEGCAVVGGYVYRGLFVPELYGKYVFGDYCYGRIWTLTLPDTVPVEKTVPLSPQPYTEAGRIAGFGEDGFGELYFVILGLGNDGAVYKIVDTALTGASRGGASGAFDLSEVAPNPFTTSSRFAVRLSRPGRLDVTIVDVAGRQVARLATGERAAGTYAFVWDGTDRTGRRAGPGTYFLRAAFDGQVSTRSLIRIR